MTRVVKLPNAYVILLFDIYTEKICRNEKQAPVTQWVETLTTKYDPQSERIADILRYLVHPAVIGSWSI